MSQPRAIFLEEKNIDVIVNSGVTVSRADLQAMIDHYENLYTKAYFVVDYTDRNGYYIPWGTMRIDYFHDSLIWTEPARQGFRHCRLK